ncbi:MAG: HAD-IC family P-type ATPase, partial [Clostridia bacterium]|nr:HAD-IC family P-type ATPase [Clostridia bacterium]
METNKDNKKQVVCKLKTLQNVPRYTPEVAVGLTAEQVESRLELGLVNTDTSNKGKSVLGIILSNTFTFFNLIYIVIATFLILCGHFEQCTFLPVVVINTLIAIVQEIRAKMTLQKLTLITQPKVQVTRDGETTQMDVDEVVLDDIVTLESGYQISADCIVLDGYVEVNESILTGESDAVVKNVGEKLFAGSFVVSGSCRARVEAVGKFNYISTLSGKAKKYQKPKSQVLGSLKAILYSVAVVIVPMIVGLYVLNADYYGSSVEGTTTWLGLNDLAITRTAGSIIPMIPVSPLLLTSVALAVSFVKLTKQGALAQELYSIEMLARVDTLCLDKTGTITDGTMRVVESLDLRNPGALYTVREIMSSYNSALKADNITSKALKKFYGAPKKTVLEATTTVPFSSLRKFS